MIGPSGGVAFLTVIYFLILSSCDPNASNLKEIRNSGHLINEDKTELIGGVDFDGNGIRDDIEAYITSRYEGEKEQAKLLMNYAKNYREALTLNSEDGELYRILTNERTLIMVCMRDLDFHNRKAGLSSIRSLHENTKNRHKEAKRIDSLLGGMTFTLPNNDLCKELFQSKEKTDSNMES